MEQIKVSDKVRVREDAPEPYAVLPKSKGFEVCEIKGDNALIRIECGGEVMLQSYIPLKYLIKVEDEAKEAKFEVGDVVRLKDIYYKEELRGRIGIIRNISGCHIYVEIDSTIYLATTHSVEPCTEPTEGKTKIKLDDLALRQPIIGIADPDHEVTYEVDWTFYTADLAKEIALKVANKFNDPEQAADYAVKMAKAVAEGLKKK